ncbi:MAG TPA: glycosyltransferase [Phycisphaerae bacterium]|nr:glycosyltransferase [Phycisphaerae bacterium]
MISILMPVKTGWQYFPQAYASVLAQEHVAWELLVGINGLPRGGEAHSRIVEAVSSNRENVHVLYLGDCTNKPQTLNTLMKSALGSHIALLDVDDIWSPWKLAKQLAYIREYDVVGTMGDWFGDVADGDTRVPLNEPVNIPDGVITFDMLLECNCFLNSSVVIRREHARWEDTDDLDDYPMWLDLANRGKKLMNIGGEPLVKIRCHPDQHFSGEHDDSKSIRERFRSLRGS